ncbi:hypothetical protein PQX77_006972 [Marasmius sp. AFHP31]|nr:hypothetical protein PQX77_006972 [Marasmius sp. AFHP31]
MTLSQVSRRAASIVLSLLVLQAVVSKCDSVLFESTEYTTGLLGDGPSQSYYSSEYTPPAWNFLVPHDPARTTPGYIFMSPRGASAAQYGAVIYDQDGHMIWYGNDYGEAMSFQVATYLGEPHILIWSGNWREIGIGYGHNLVLNRAYEVVANYTTDLDGETGRTLADFHDTQITSDNTGLVVAYQEKAMDLTRFNGPSSGWILDGVAQEVNITSGQALWTWKASEHVDFSDCGGLNEGDGLAPENAWDFFHINSVEKDGDGNFLISARHCAVYYISGTDGHVIWSLGGNNPSFEMEGGTHFSFQHDARWISKDENKGRMSLFDNAGIPGFHNADYARGLIIELDFESRKATLVQEYLPWNRAVSESQGSAQVQPNGNVLVGWGQEPWLAEYAQSGELVWTAQFGVSNVQSYRALRYNWTGLPNTAPSLEVLRGKTSLISAYASWNGATEISRWEVLGATSEDGEGMVSLYNRTKRGFETTITVGGSHLENYSHFAVRAIDRQNQSLGQSTFMRPSNGVLKVMGSGRVGMAVLVLGMGWILQMVS